MWLTSAIAFWTASLFIIWLHKHTTFGYGDLTTDIGSMSNLGNWRKGLLIGWLHWHSLFAESHNSNWAINKWQQFISCLLWLLTIPNFLHIDVALLTDLVSCQQLVDLLSIKSIFLITAMFSVIRVHSIEFISKSFFFLFLICYRKQKHIFVSTKY